MLFLSVMARKQIPLNLEILSKMISTATDSKGKALVRYVK
uniref:Uncharacterized protein n=1 Tax=Anguilla anguilla TaxID=7936 RepID=A0A0E9UQX8_ANGAN